MPHDIIPLESISFLKKKKKPMESFLKAHFLQMTLQSVSIEKSPSRILYFNFTNDKKLEIRLFPVARNFLAFSENKKISWFKPKELPVSNTNIISFKKTRTLDEIKVNWQNQKQANILKKESSYIKDNSFV